VTAAVRCLALQLPRHDPEPRSPVAGAEARTRNWTRPSGRGEPRYLPTRVEPRGSRLSSGRIEFRIGSAHARAHARTEVQSQGGAREQVLHRGTDAGALGRGGGR